MKTFHTLLIILTALVLLASSRGSTAAQQATSVGPIADVSISEKEILWAPRVPYAGLILTIAAPDGTVAPYTFGPGTAPALRVHT